MNTINHHPVLADKPRSRYSFLKNNICSSIENTENLRSMIEDFLADDNFCKVLVKLSDKVCAVLKDFGTISAPDLDNLPPITWLVPNLLQENTVTFLAGPPGTGKSFLAAQLAFGLATGSQAWGHELGDPGFVVYLTGGEGVSG